MSGRNIAIGIAVVAVVGFVIYMVMRDTAVAVVGATMKGVEEGSTDIVARASGTSKASK